MTNPTLSRAPITGEPLYMDGFWYRIGASELRPASDGQMLEHTTFFRPDVFAHLEAMAARVEHKQSEAYRALPQAERAASLDAVAAMPAKSEAHRKNVNYKHDGMVVSALFHLMSPADALAALDEQTDQLISAGGANSKVWARAARAVQRAELSALDEPFWVIGEPYEAPAPGTPEIGWRLLMKPTRIRVQKLDKPEELTELTVYPMDAKEASGLVEVLRASGDVPQAIANLTSWKAPASTQIVRW